MHSWNTGGEPELITVLHTDCMHVHRRKQFTILQLVQLSSVKSSLSITPYDVYSSQSTLLVGGDVTNRQRACCRLVSVVGLQRSVVPRPWLHVARACTLTLSTQQAILVPRVDQACNCRSDSRSWWQLSRHCAAMGVVV